MLTVGVRGGAAAVGGGAGTLTVIRTLSLALPPGPMAVAMYVTEDVGLTARVPVAETSPRPGSILTLVALRVSQRSVVVWPRSTVPGSARNVIVGAAGAGWATGCVGGAAATCFLHPARATIPSATSPIVRKQSDFIIF